MAQLESQSDVLVTPVTQKSRISSIDTLRGFALLGILIMNIQSFGFIGTMYLFPTAMGPWQGWDYPIWSVGFLLFDTKMMTIFSMLFGAGIVLMWEKSKKAGRPFTALHYKRMAVLLIFGILHAYLIWPGDILFTYAICGMVVYWLCGLSPKWQLGLGFTLVLLGILITIGMGKLTLLNSEAELQKMAAEFSPSQEKIAKEISTMQGSYWKQMEVRVPGAFFMQLFLVPFFIFFRCCGLMLIGMSLFKMGIMSCKKSQKFYWTTMIVSFLVGISFVGFSKYQLEANGFDAFDVLFFSSQWNLVGTTFVSISYICGIMLFCQSGLVSWLRHALASVGQMALTNYLGQSILCTLFFYGHGLGYFGQLNRLEALGVVAAVWAIQLVLSPIWIKRFQFGPAEWLWRSISYWKFQPILRKAIS